MTEREALKLALEALEESGITWKTSRAIAAIKEALMSQSDGAQPEHSATHGGPVAVVDLRNVNYVRWLDGSVFFEGTKLYTTPPQPKPLTDEQFQAIKDSLSRQEGWDGEGWAGESWDLALKKAIEAAHNIKE